MSVTFGVLKTEVAEALRDPDNRTFDNAALGRLVNMGMAEVGRYAPELFREEITPVEDQMEYVLRSDEFGGEAVPEIEVTRVEIWDGSTVPPTQIAVVGPASSEYVNSSDVGWTNWGGTLYLPTWTHTAIDTHEAEYVIRVYGYSPYAPLTDDDEVASVSNEVQWAIVSFCQVEALQRLVNERDLFSQWQTRAGNTDISPAGLMNALNIARDEWRRRSRSITRLRSPN